MSEAKIVASDILDGSLGSFLSCGGLAFKFLVAFLHVTEGIGQGGSTILQGVIVGPHVNAEAHKDYINSNIIDRDEDLGNRHSQQENEYGRKQDRRETSVAVSHNGAGNEGGN